MDECIDNLPEGQQFSTLDAVPGFRKIKIDEQDQYSTAPTSGHGLKQYKTMPSRLNNA